MFLTIKNLYKTLNQKPILENINFQAQKGEIIAIIGPSGSGKSTLLRCINFLETPDYGEINLDNLILEVDHQKKVNHKKINAFRKKVTMVFQHFNLWSHLNVYQNIVEAPIKVLGKTKEEMKIKAQKLLKKVSLANYFDYFPAQLSGGQKQRIAIARALAMEPEVILFDEPTSALDPELIQEVLMVIKNLAQEKLTMIIVSHEINFIKNVANKIIFLYEGKIEIMGSIKEIFKSKNKKLKKFLANVK